MLREQTGAMLVEALVTVVIVVLVLTGAVFAIAQVGAGQRFSGAILNASTQMRVAANIVGEDVSHAADISVDPASSWNPDLDDPVQDHPGYWVLTVKQDQLRSAVTYMLLEDVPGEWTLYRITDLSTVPVLTGLVPGMTGFVRNGTTGGVRVVLTTNVPYGTEKHTFTVKSFFNPRGAL